MQKFIEVDGIDQPVLLARRVGTRNLKITMKSDGTIRVSVPHGVPEVFAKKFIQSKSDWIAKHTKPKILIPNGSHIGKSHTLRIYNSDIQRHSTKISTTDIVINLPLSLEINSTRAQTIIKKACEKALQTEAEILLPQRLEQLSLKHKIPYKSCDVKKLKSRWGACDSFRNISLNSYLIQLDWSLIDYVICHELAHTTHPHHQPDFWSEVEKMLPDFKERRKVLKTKPTDVLLT